MNWEIVASVALALVVIGMWHVPNFERHWRAMREHNLIVARQKRLAKKHQDEAYREYMARMARKSIDQ